MPLIFLEIQHSAFSAFSNLEYLGCSENQLTNLDVDGCQSLKTLDCSKNQLACFFAFKIFYSYFNFAISCLFSCYHPFPINSRNPGVCTFKSLGFNVCPFHLNLHLFPCCNAHCFCCSWCACCHCQDTSSCQPQGCLMYKT